MLGDISPQTVRITQQAVVYTGRDHVASLRVERFDGRTYKPVDMTAVTRVILSFPEADPVIVYDSAVQAVFTHVGTTLTVDLSDYAMPASVLGCQIILYDAEHPAGQVLVDDIDAVVQFDFRNVSPVGGIPAPAVDYLADAPTDGVTYARKDGVWVPVDALVSGVSSVNGQSGVVVLDAADVGADPVGTATTASAAAVAAHTALADPHPQYLTPAEGNAAYDASGAATSAVSAHVADSDPHPQYTTQSEGDARYERGLTAGANITIDRTNPVAPVISASGGGGGGAVDSVNGQTGVVVLDAADVGADAAGTAAAAAAAHVAATNPHPEYLTTAEGDAAYAPIAHVGAGGAAHSNAVAAGAAGFMTGADKTKLDGIAAGAQVNVGTNISVSYNPAYVLVNSSTGTDDTIAAATGAAAGVMSSADKVKLDGIATGATQNSSDAFLLTRGNHTGTQPASTISDFTEAAQDVVGASVVAGANVTVTYDDGTGLTTVAASSGAALPVVRAITANETLAMANINTFGVNSTTSDYTSTIPAQATVAWTADAEMHFLPSNTGDITVTAAAGVSLNGVVAGSLTLRTQNGAASLKRTGADSWWLGGVIGTTAEQRSALGLGSISGINRLINGAFDINQRAVTGTVTLAAGAYGHDRWKAGASGCTYTFATTANVMTITITAGSLQQVIEGVNLQSGTHTLSWTGTAQGKIGAGSYGTSGITAAVVGGTNLTVEFNTGTLSFAQLQSGATALPFDHRFYGQELELCRRYYETITGAYAAAGYSASYIMVDAPFLVEKRATPTIIVTAYGRWIGADAANAITAMTFLYTNTRRLGGDATAFAGTMVAGFACHWRSMNLAASAEL